MIWYFGTQGQKLQQADVMSQLEKETDRGAALVGGSIAEFWCESALRAIMTQEDKVLGFLFQSSGPLGPFRVKIDLLYALGYLSDQAHRDLSTVKGIRNDFAHRLDALTFADGSVKDRCGNLTLVDKYIGDFTADEKRAISEAMKAGVPPDFTPGPGKMIRISNADEILRSPRQRYVATIQLSGFLLGKAIDSHKALPEKFPFKKPVL